ncbi:unnamed protein product [Durusdinium trenchii]|uniref:Uncharacterized protein n=1 Tax=Durusdinium trenchii TaxID=1381693 RepID=A0ABP0SW66_9DINO
MVHQEGRGDKGTALMERISTATYDACRSQRLKLEGFPDVQPLLLEMQKTSGAGENSPAIDGSSFKVTVQQPGGALVVKEQFFEQFDEVEEFSAIVEQHNKSYNPDNIRLKESVVTTPKPEILKTQLVSSDEPLTGASLTSLPNVSTLQVNSQVCLICDQSGEKIYAMAEEQCTLLSMRELCSFGSGTWCDGPDAKELQQSDNKWLACSMTLDSHIILEKKHLLQHLQNLSCLEKPATLREVLTLLEDAGEATVPQGIFMSESD